MNKVMLAVGILTMFVVISSPAFAKLFETDSNGHGIAGKSSIFHLYLYEKDASTWNIVEGGAWGKMTYNLEKGKFVFNGHMLEPGTGYTLINFVRGFKIDGADEAWGTAVQTVLGTGRVDEHGNIHIKGHHEYTESNWGYDYTGILEGDTSAYPTGYKVWLVLSSDMDAGHLVGWTPAEYLFEYELIPSASE